ncbi:SH3-containing GRB2-like 3-interacting protein 1, partial [Chaetura pelagica]
KKTNGAPNGFYAEIDWDRYNSPELDEEGYSIRPEEPGYILYSPPTKGKHFYSSSESEEEEEAHKKFNIKIKPLQAKDVLKSAATVDELKASIGNIALSPSPVGTIKRNLSSEEIARPRRSTPTPDPASRKAGEDAAALAPLFGPPLELAFEEQKLEATLDQPEIWGSAQPLNTSVESPKLPRPFPTGTPPPLPPKNIPATPPRTGSPLTVGIGASLLSDNYSSSSNNNSNHDNSVMLMPHEVLLPTWAQGQVSFSHIHVAVAGPTGSSAASSGNRSAGQERKAGGSHLLMEPGAVLVRRDCVLLVQPPCAHPCHPAATRDQFRVSPLWSFGGGCTVPSPVPSHCPQPGAICSGSWSPLKRGCWCVTSPECGCHCKCALFSGGGCSVLVAVLCWLGVGGMRGPFSPPIHSSSPPPIAPLARAESTSSISSTNSLSAATTPTVENEQPSLVWFDRGKFYLTFEGDVTAPTLGANLPLPLCFEPCPVSSPPSPGLRARRCRCIVKITGEMVLSFPAGITRHFANNPAPAVLTFRVLNYNRLEHVLPNPQLLCCDNTQSDTTTKEFWVNMSNLMTHLKKVSEQKPQATYYNVDMLKYQVSAQGIQSTPLNLAVSWRCDPASTDLRIDYKYNTEAMTTPVALNNVQFLVPVDGGVTKLQAVLPPAVWNAEQQRILWKIPDISQKSENGGVGSLLARFQLSEGPSTPAPLAVQFTSEGSTLSSCDIELVGAGYRFSLIKKRFAAGRFL